MSEHDPDRINRLIARFTDLQARWQRDPQHFDWTELQQLARDGATAYNEDGGRSFHSLALEGVRHDEFHERFLAESLRAGFDPFKLGATRSDTDAIAVLDHASLAEAARDNASSARMHAALMEAARRHFAPLAAQSQGKSGLAAEQFREVEASAASIPDDLLQQIAPRLARAQQGAPSAGQPGPSEGYLSAAEKIVENRVKPLG